MSPVLGVIRLQPTPATPPTSHAKNNNISVSVHMLLASFVIHVVSFNGLRGCNALMHPMMSATHEPSAVVLSCPKEEAMLPGEYRWIQIVDEQQANDMCTARRAPFNGLLAQLFPGSSCTAVPLLQLMPSRKADTPGALVEVLCIGRCKLQQATDADDGVASSTVCAHVDAREKNSGSDDAVRELRAVHAMCMRASRYLVEMPSENDADGEPAGELRALIKTPLDQQVSERWNSLNRRVFEAHSLSHFTPSRDELFSLVACSCLKPASRVRAIEMTSTQERLVLCVEQLRHESRLLSARLSVMRALSS